MKELYHGMGDLSMAIERYLAMTASEMQAILEYPERIGWMACHFSPYGTGLSNLPESLPSGSMLILNDRTPICGHDPNIIIRQLTEAIEALECGCLLLDFQRDNNPETQALAKVIAEALPCPVGVSHLYAEELDCAVFLPSVPPDAPLAAYLAPWKGREVWLEAALDGLEITITEQGVISIPLLHGVGLDGAMHDEKLHCHYQIQTDENSAKFTLFRTCEDLNALVAEADNLGVRCVVGLFQEFGSRGLK